MQSVLCYSAGMAHTRYHFSLCLALCVMLSACVQTGAKKADVMDMYELPRAGHGTTIYVAPVDNDSYYVQPTGYKGCAQISDAPSCAGGG